VITISFGYIQLRTCLQRYLLKRLLRQSGYEWTIRQPSPPFEGSVGVLIDNQWLHYPNHHVTGVILASHLSTCAARYMHRFKSMSHPYILPWIVKDQSSVLLHRRPHSFNDSQERSLSQ